VSTSNDAGVLVIGGGQAGLAIGYQLADRGIECMSQLQVPCPGSARGSLSRRERAR
jgi:glycine/D-amino acid oxidase-like deaminating enzyme